jgi:mannose-binding lectin 1
MYISKSKLRAFALSTLSIGAALVSAEEDWEYTHNYVEDGIIEDLTFGAHGSIWTKDHRHITGWTISGEGYQPELMSDRIILTPPYPGNKRGSIWAQHAETHDEWEAEFEFRATGPERGSGNLQLWFARDPERDIKHSSIYTVGHFDGLVLTIGQYGGHGTLRAFLNDGSVSFKDHHHVDQLSFASCDFNYRNLGYFSHVMVKQTPYTFEVEIDHVNCFRTHKVRTFGLPTGLYEKLIPTRFTCLMATTLVSPPPPPKTRTRSRRNPS